MAPMLKKTIDSEAIQPGGYFPSRRTWLLCCGALAAPLTILAAVAKRTVSGRVSDRRGTALKGAVVQLTNPVSRRIRSFMTDAQGNYRFGGLDPNLEYELRARYRGVWSEVKRVSIFDAKLSVEIDLVVPL
jgi:hypothetical protein